MPQSASEQQPLDVLIVGGGPAGLTTAYTLLKEGGKGQNILVLESHPTLVGGISRTEEYKNFLFDIGGHRFFSKSAEVNKLWHEILPGDFLMRPRQSRIFYRKKFYSYPLRAVEALLNLGIWESTLCVLSYVKGRFFPMKPETSFRAWVSNRFGKQLFTHFFKSYTEKVWGISCDELSADWAAQRIRGLNLFKAILSALGLNALRRGDATVIKTLIDKFQYPRKGPGMMWAAAKEKIIAMGGVVQMGITTKSYAWHKDKGLWQVSAIDGNGQAHSFWAKNLVASAPLRETVNAITPKPASADAISNLNYRDFILIALMIKGTDIFPDNWIYIHEPALMVGRIQNFLSWSPEMVPEAGMACVGMEYFCNEGDNFWVKDDNALIAFATEEWKKLGLSPKCVVVDGHVVRQPKAYPVYDDHYKNILETFRKDFDAHYPTFYPVGRNGMHRYNNQDHAMMTGMLTARNILAGNKQFDVWNVNEDAEYHEEGEDKKVA